VKYLAKRPQVQERLTLQITEYLQNALNTEHVAVILDAEHYCIISRGIEDINSTTVTSEFRGKFQEYEFQNKLFQMIV